MAKSPCPLVEVRTLAILENALCIDELDPTELNREA
jgi:hypothetical protein